MEKELELYNYFGDSTNNEIPELGDILVCHTPEKSTVNTINKKYTIIRVSGGDTLWYVSDNSDTNWVDTIEHSQYYWKKFFNLIKKHA